ncbi:DUF3108 domain-containing protein [Chromobacterium sphagni]|uniref:DUF3108 domain-containing protein n=1 Tax=Chromobacterium sphagni TaxID=1903179 RepID=A0ABX3CAJ9_9NEIS|nr:DUF3108 domain-containing protein [Chromobacterium sphagni]OHX19312.1 hypothetical protein BI344_09325 [Chromobacterium sphagni]
MTRRRLLLIALVLSFALHLLLLGSDLLPEISLQPAETPKLEKIDVKMQALRLDQPEHKPPPVSSGVSLAPAARRAAKKTAAKPRPKRKQAASQAVADKQSASAPAEAPAAPPMMVAASSEAVAENTLPQAEERSGHHKDAHAQSSSPSHEAASTAKIKPEDKETPPPSGPTAAAEGFIQPPHPLRKFPGAAKLTYDLYLNSGNVGTGVLNWQQGNGRYRLETVATPKFALRLFTKGYSYRVEGQIGNSGLRPDSMQSFEGEQAKEEARFDYAAGLLHYGLRGEQQLPLQPGAQDIYSLAFQLGLKGGQLGDKPLQITTAKKVYDYPMASTGTFDYDTNAGKMRVVVFQAKGGGDITEFWLAPDFANLPVRITRIDDKKRIELRAIRIEINGALQWELPPQPTIRNKNAH